VGEGADIVRRGESSIGVPCVCARSSGNTARGASIRTRCARGVTTDRRDGEAERRSRRSQDETLSAALSSRSGLADPALAPTLPTYNDPAVMGALAHPTTLANPVPYAGAAEPRACARRGGTRTAWKHTADERLRDTGREGDGEPLDASVGDGLERGP
jgi:hypothetical protein